jgi:prophage DNA circulation protein
MTLFNNSKLKIAQFKNAKFFLDNSNLKGGIKFAEFEYPKTDKRDIESLGRLLKKISIRCIIDCNKNYTARDKLQKAFDEPKAGNLSLPFYKKFYGYVTEYSFTDSKTAIGTVDVNFEFAEVSKKGGIDKKGKGFLAQLKSDILGACEDDFDKAIATVKDSKEKFDSFVDTLTEISTTINQTASAVAGAGDSLGDFSTSINQIIGSANNLVKAPKTLFNNIRIAFDNLGVAFESSKDLFKTCKDLFGIDKKDRDQIGNSQNSIDIRNNQNLINQAIRINALTLGYETSAAIDYTNTQELNNAITDLENGFSKIDFSLINDLSIIDNLQQLRYQAINYLNQLRLSVPNIIDYEVANPTPLTKILFSLYGNDSEENREAIININNFQDTSNVNGVIKVLKYVSTE